MNINREVLKQADDMILMIVCLDAANKPGAFIQKYGHRWPYLKDFKPEDFQKGVNWYGRKSST